MSGERGLALVNALVIVAMLSATALALQARALQGIEAGRIERDGAQAKLYLDAGATLAELVLRLDAANSSIDSLDEDWARPDVAVAVDRGRLQVSLADLQGLFNLNLLADPDDPTAARATFARLCDLLGLAPATAPRLAEAMLRAGPVDSAAALPEIPGLPDDTWDRLRPVVTLLPDRPALNVNTAPGPVLAAHLPDLSAEQIDTLLTLRRDAPFEDAAAFAATVRPMLPPAQRESENFRRFSTDSGWFALTATADLGDIRKARITVLHRPPEDAPIRRVRHEVLWR